MWTPEKDPSLPETGGAESVAIIPIRLRARACVRLTEGAPGIQRIRLARQRWPRASGGRDSEPRSEAGSSAFHFCSLPLSEVAVKRALAGVAGDGVVPQDVSVKLSAGSVVADASVFPSDGSSPSALRRRRPHPRPYTALSVTGLRRLPPGLHSCVCVCRRQIWTLSAGATLHRSGPSDWGEESVAIPAGVRTSRRGRTRKGEVGKWLSLAARRAC